ncbi:alpha-ketoglutarate decarboxylase [uncultured Croceitalea sp.]|uniref:alpha-ketoglutarate decarboxylase n=1 Tax=uncultured Croceitalea sp. TaxID=1798908 RepID=UPI003305EE95
MNRLVFQAIRQITLILTFCCVSIVNSQQLTNNNFWENVRYGGGIGLGFSNNAFTAAISPSAIYQVSNSFATGVGLNFNYTKFDNDKFIAYGAGLMNFYNPIPEIQLSTELEQWRINRTEEISRGSTFKDNYWSTALFLGLGYTTRNVTVGLRYDILYDEDDSIYVDPLMPFVRVFF